MPSRSESAERAWTTRESVLQEVRQIVGDYMEIPPERIRESDELLADLGCDSLDVIEITMELEEHFDVSVPDDVAGDVRTVGDVADGLMRLLEADRPA